MACYNRNTQEYKDLLNRFDSNMQVDSIINSWQIANKSDEFPTVAEAEELLKNNKIAFNLKQKNFGETILANLSNKGWIHKYKNQYYVNNSDRNNKVYDEGVLARNLAAIKNYLEINNIPLNTIRTERTKKSIRISVEYNMFTPTDMLEKTRSWDKPKSRHVVAHLMKLFPGVRVNLVSVAEAKVYYDSLDSRQKANIKFEDVNSYFDPVNNQVVLIKGRVTDETAIEEMLHPFTDALYVDNKTLFDNLLKEARKNFPLLSQQIDEAYSDKKGFNKKHRDLELVTQALTRHFKKEYEENPTKTFLERVKEFIEWFASIINNFHKYITGNPININLKDIKPNTKLSDIAKLLNTSDIQFDVNARADAKIRFSLTPDLQKTVNYALKQSNDIQKEVINRLFFQATQAKEEVDVLAAGDSGPIVILNEKDHTYYNLLDTTEVYQSTTERIKGKMSEDDLFNKKLNLDLGNDFDIMLQGITSDKSLEEIASQMKVLNQEQIQKAYSMLQETLSDITRDGGVAIPQVVVYDKVTKTAGTIDIVVVKPNGELRIVDLKTSKNSIDEMIAKEKAKQKAGLKSKTKYDTEWELSDSSDLKKLGVNELSTRAQQGIQVNMYRRMLENMGYEVDMSDYGATTFHIKVGVKGKDANQEFTGEFEADREVIHKANDSVFYVDMLIPYRKDQFTAEQIKENTKNSDDALVDFKDIDDLDIELPEGFEAIDPQTEYQVISQALESYKLGLINKLKALKTIKSAIYMDRTQEQTEENIHNSIALITTAMAEGPKARSAMYTELLRDALKQVNNFIEYVKDPNNFDKPEYISYVLNFNRFIKTYEGLHSIKSSKDINATQRTLISEFQIKLNELTLSSQQGDSLIDQAIGNYVKEQIKNWSSRDDLTEDILNDLLKYVDDIQGWEYLADDIATSRDTLLAVMDKIYKAKVQEALDKSNSKAQVISGLASRLQKLSPNKNTQELYDFFLVFDDNGEFTGRYVKKVGDQYYKKENELRDKLLDENGNWLQYRDVTDIATAKQEDLEFNKKLAKAKLEYSKFMSAEKIGRLDKLEPGDYHRYSDEFIEERKKYEYYVNINGRPVWKRKAGISALAWQKYLAKYYNEVQYTASLKDVNGQPTGIIRKGQTYNAVKPEYVIINDRNSTTNESLLSEKYEKIMNPTNALERVQKEFYEAFVDIYENDLLNKIPMGIRGQMLGKVPLIKGKLFQDVKGKPNIVAKLWTKGVRNYKNLVNTTMQQRAVTFDEEGNLVDQLPVFYTGKPRNDKELEAINNEINTLQETRKKGLISKTKYDKELAILRGKYNSLIAKPSLGEINKDMGAALLRFNQMAQYYDTLSTAEDTFKAFIKVIEKRKYNPSNPAVQLGVFKKDKFTPKATIPGEQSNVAKRARKWMSMVYYDNDQITKGFLEKVTDGLINYSSLSYVAFNPFGNFNNYALGRINNSIEAIGQRFYSIKSYKRAEYEFNKRAIPDLIHRLSSTTEKLTGSKSDYDPELPGSKYEALVDLFRMMDQKSDIREVMGPEPLKKSYFQKATEFGYVLQDAAEYNVQTKVGMAILIDTNIMNKSTGDIISLYDAFEFDSETKGVKLKDGYDTIVTLDKTNLDENGNSKIIKEQAYNDQFRYQLRNKIREVNKQIHGNYARPDRMVMQSYAVGRLVAQFHKWVAPAIKARFRREYFDENLGWMEGRYRSFWKFFNYAFEKMAKAEFDFTNYKEGFLKDYGFTGDGSQVDQKALDKLFNTYRVLGEIGIILSTIALNLILESMFRDDDDDESDFEKRLENILRYQADRTYKELILFTPLGAEQVYQMFKSPIASTRTLGELAEALYSTVETPLGYAFKSKEEFYADSDYVYQRGIRKGEIKLKKQWADVVPILYSIKKYKDYLNLTNFFIK